MILAARPWIVAVILGLVALSPARAGMTPEEVKEFEGNKIKAEKGDAVAQFNLGSFYAYGNGVTKDYAEAAKWWRKAAEMGDVGSQGILGSLYILGLGVEKDDIEAYAYFNLPGWGRRQADELEKKMSVDQVADGQKLSRHLQSEIDARKVGK